MQGLAPLLIAIGALSLAGCSKHAEAPDTHAGATPETSQRSESAQQSETTSTPSPAAEPTRSNVEQPTANNANDNTGTNSSGTSTAAATAAAGGTDLGKTVYTQTCSMCHAAGIAGAPKIGDKADWGPRIAKGKDTLYQHAIAGFQGSKGVMPPKGGSTRPDAEVKAAVDYMVSQAK
jgi:cytochrome c5